MNISKQQYLSEVRADSAYPTYRGFIGTITLLGYVLAGAFGLSALVGGLTSMSHSFMAGLGVLIIGAVWAALTFLLARFFKEAALILADIGDLIAEANSRGSLSSSAQTR